MTAAAMGTASKPPTSPRSEVPRIAATIVTRPGIDRLRFIIRGVIK